MYLKNLEIQGFKSFADRLRLEFKQGITSVVGPNGSGKSNIADAVRWVLGEQSAKTLRGSRMDDVIFTGTRHRKPLGFAEVSITLDNSDKALPSEYEELTVTRRIYRSGESEYLINKTHCRLKDINSLFMDTGIGRDGYSIIGQGRIDEILSSKSEDRRLIFEEASGIMKYKVRKAEAEHKLEQTGQNLLRINDVISEMENQLEPLRIQSEKAREFLALREKLKDLEINVYIDNISRYKSRIEEYIKDADIIRDGVKASREKLEALSEKQKEAFRYSNELEIKLDEARKSTSLLNEEADKIQAGISLNNEKIKNLEENAERLENEINETGTKTNALEAEKAGKLKKLAYLQGVHAQYSEKLAECEKKANEMMRLLDENEKKIEAHKNSLMDKMDALSEKKLASGSVRNHIQQILKRNLSIEKEISEAVYEADREHIKKEEIREQLEILKKEASQKAADIAGSSEKNREMSGRLADIRADQSNLRASIQNAVSRHRVLKEMEENYEGYSRSVKAILKIYTGKENPESSGIHGVLAGIISVSPEYTTAVEAALGGALQNIVTSDEYDARKAIDFLRKNNYGRATFLPLSSVRGKAFDETFKKELSGFKGYLDTASEIIITEERYNPLIQSLLGRVAVVSDMDCGILMARKYKYSFKIVTLNGEVLNPGGSISGGSMNERISGLLNRGREIEELSSAITKMKAQDADLEKKALALSANMQLLIKEIEKLKSELHESEIASARHEELIARHEEASSRLKAKSAMLREEISQNDLQTKKAEEEAESLEKECAAIETEAEELKALINESQEKNKVDRNARESLFGELTDYKISVSSVNENIDAVRADTERIDREIMSVQGSIDKKQSGIHDSKAKIAEITSENEGLAITLKSCEENRIGRNLEAERLAEEKRVVSDELSEISELIAAGNEELILLKEDLSRAEVKSAKAETELEQVQNRLWDEYSLTYNNALQFKKDIGSITKAQKEIADIKKGIDELGPVNVAAIDEYVKIKERHGFMKAQSDDMQDSIGKLHAIIGEMTGIMKKQFTEQFGLINSHFGLVFKELFGGGT
ncbi:MAG: chromosome segregation protein SMC, partial [Eubacteriales bacterium]|nr:chromosome segregation protein SMC [Eubacteriales bacterium]